ncbi:MAG: Uma2 family endonuclease [Saprospiraceae bacterium]|nr:Uma2 family endonuclease [Saprospiraceae bacterium]
MEIRSLDQLDLKKHYTYGEYLMWRLEERVELLRGKIFKMSPAPNVLHQKISSNIQREISWFLKKSPCKVFAAPFDVRLPLPKNLQKKGFTSDKIDTVVQPDICIVCDENKLDVQGCNGAPDLIVEILSPGNSKKEMRDKYEIYELAGVKEYWVVFASEQVLQRYILINNKYVPQLPNVQGDQVGITFLSGFELLVDEVFE